MKGLRVLDRDQFRRLQALAKLRLSPREEEVLLPQLERIVRFVGELEASPPRAEPLRVSSPKPPRDDVPREGLDRAEALAGAASSAGDLFRVPPALPPETP